MFNLKSMSKVFIIGFLLSFLAGVVGRVDFAIILLRALISGFLFTALFIGAKFVYNTFLNSVDTAESTPTEKASENSVDIVIDDDLPDSETAPTFDLGSYVNQQTSPSNTRNEKTDEASLEAFDESGHTASTEPNESFQTAPLEGVASSAGMANMQESIQSNNSSIASNNISNEIGKNVEERDIDSSVDEDSVASQLGVLPDIDSFVTDEEGALVEDEGVIQDSEFAQTGQVRPSAVAPVSEMGDAKEIAAAIRTALVKDM